MKYVRSAAVILLNLALPLLLVSAAHAQTGDATLLNPVAGNPAANSVSGFIAYVLKALVKISLPIITVFIVYSGYLFVAARGNPGDIAKAKKNFMYVIIGSALILGAWVIATVIGNTITQVVNG